MNNILVINGSPKGKNSITPHTCLFLGKKFPGYKFDYLDAGQRIKVLEKVFSPALEAIREADFLVFPFIRSSSRASSIAFWIKDHSMGGRFKRYDDRQFCNGHRTVTMGTAR